MKFSIISFNNTSSARNGLITTDHSEIETPVFMPIGTNGVIKTILPKDLYDINTNNFHNKFLVFCLIMKNIKRTESDSLGLKKIDK